MKSNKLPVKNSAASKRLKNPHPLKNKKVKKIDFSSLSVFRKERLVALPTISVCIYFSKPACEIARSIADAIDAYQDLIGRDKLNQYRGTNEWKNLTLKKLQADMEKLRKYSKGIEKWFSSEYNSSDVLDCPGPYGVCIQIRDEFLESAPLSTNFLRLDFDINIIMPDKVEAFVKWYTNLLENLSFHSSHSGYAYKRLGGMQSLKASPGVDRKISRYYGFDPGYEGLSDKMLLRTGNPQWLNAIDQSLIDKLGGFARVSNELQTCQLTKLKSGLLIRGANLPPLGDIKRGALDIASIPEIARLFKPLRTPISAFQGPLLAQEWLARYDEMENREWG